MASSLDLVIEGAERTAVRYTTHEGHGDDRKTVRRTARSRRRILHLDVPLAKFPDGKLSPGKYEFPFVTTMPATLPSTMKVGNASLNGCRIDYIVKARLSRPGLLKFDATTANNIVVLGAPLHPTATPTFIQPAIVPVNVCCCIGKGKMTIGATTSNNSVGRGQEIEVKVACLNESSESIQFVDIALVQQVRYTARGRDGTKHGHSHAVLAKVRVDPSSIAGTDKLEEGAVADASPLAKIYEQLSAAGGRVNLTCSPEALDTYNGSLIDCNHTLAVTMTTPGCCVTNPAIKTAIRVGTAPSTTEVTVPAFLVAEDQTQPFEKPADWSDVVTAEVVTISLVGASVGGAVADVDDDADDFAPVVVEAPPPTSAEGLRSVVKDAYDCKLVLESLSEAAEWAQVLAGLSPDDYGGVVGAAGAFNQVPVAEVLAGKIAGGVTCAHLAAAVQAADEFRRTDVVKAVGPLCADRGANAGAVTALLSDWEQIVTRSAFD